MFVKVPKEIKQNPDCTKCESFSICKYAQDKISAEKKLEDIKKSLPPFSPIRINMTCGSYKEKIDLKNTFYIGD